MVLPWYCNTTSTAVLPYCTCQQISYFSEDFCAKNQFIDQLNKLKVFKLYVYDILVQLVSDGAASPLLIPVLDCLCFFHPVYCVLLLQTSLQQVKEIREITRIERIGKSQLSLSGVLWYMVYVEVIG